MVMYTFEDHWEGWLRPLLLILVGLALGGAWWLGWLPDAWLGGALLVAALLGPAGVVLSRVWSGRLATWKRIATTVVSLAAVAVASLSPASILAPGAGVAAGEASRRAPEVPIPAAGDGPREWMVYAHGEPGFDKSSADLVVALDPARGEVRQHTAKLTEKRGGKRGGGAERHDVVWRVRADLSRGAVLRVETPPRELTWPVVLQLRRAPPSHRALLYAALPLLLLGVLLDGLLREHARTYLGPLAAGAGAFAMLFAVWFTPGALVKTVFGATFGAAVAGAVVGVPLAAIAARLVRREGA